MIVTRALSLLTFIGWVIVITQFPLCFRLIRYLIRRWSDRRLIHARVRDMAVTAMLADNVAAEKTYASLLANWPVPVDHHG